MPWRLIGLLIILTIFVIFSGYNAHKIIIHFGPFSMTEVPLFVALVSTFILGAFTALPFTIITSIKRKRKLKKEKKMQSIAEPAVAEPPLITNQEDIQNVTPEDNKTADQESRGKKKTRTKPKKK